MNVKERKQLILIARSCELQEIIKRLKALQEMIILKRLFGSLK